MMLAVAHDRSTGPLDVALSRTDALALMTEYTQSESLRKHMLAVEAAVRGYARLWGEDEDDWGAVALLHDFDYERWPDAENHPVSRRRHPEREGVSRVGDARHPVARGLLRRRQGVPPRARALRVRRDVGIRDRGVARPAVEEHSRSRSAVRDQADEGQGVRARGEPGRSSPGPRKSACRSTSTSPTSLASCASRRTCWDCAARSEAAANSGIQISVYQEHETWTQ